MNRIPLRTCIGCLAKKPKSELVRLVWDNSRATPSSGGKNLGRGAYLCRQGQKVKKTCLIKAEEKNAFKKAFKKKVCQVESFSHSGSSAAGCGRVGAH